MEPPRGGGDEVRSRVPAQHRRSSWPSTPGFETEQEAVLDEETSPPKPGTYLLLGLLMAIAIPALGQSKAIPLSPVIYRVTFDRELAKKREVAVEVRLNVHDQDSILLSFPAWTPGSYGIQDYSRAIRGFEARRGTQSLVWDKSDHDTWRIRVPSRGEVTVSFRYATVVRSTGNSWTAGEDFGFFNGTNLFPFLEGRDMERPSTLEVKTEDDWRVACGLERTGPGASFVAPDYHALVDNPIFIGRFDLDERTLGGKRYRLALHPVGVMDAKALDGWWQAFDAMLKVFVPVFGEVPWKEYTVLLECDDDMGNGGAALEHGTSFFGIVGREWIGKPRFFQIVAHELFHAWNVKRLRPRAMVPYDYARPRPTPLLWISEGFTDYYADLALVRGKISEEAYFWKLTGGKIRLVKRAPAVSLEDCSLSTWVNPTNGTGMLYYFKGSLIGLVLDIAIRDATENERSLDDVMRALWERTARKGRGFSDADVWWCVEHIAGRSFEEFRRRWVDGRERVPWKELLAPGGVRIVKRDGRQRVEPDPEATEKAVRIRRSILGT